MNSQLCPACLKVLPSDHANINSRLNEFGSLTPIKCDGCGEFLISGSCKATMTSEDDQPDSFGSCGSRKRANLSAWIREQGKPKITSHDLPKLLALKPPSFHEKSNKLLLELEKQTKFAGEFIQIKNRSWLAITWSLKYDELYETLRYLYEVDRIRINVVEKELRATIIESKGVGVKVSAKGWEHLEKLSEINPESHQIFIAMWFTPSLNKVLDHGFVPAIEDDAGYKALRIDRKEHINKIDDEIIAEIRKSRIVVADFTGHRGGVYFEAGYAIGLGIPVIWTCRKKSLKRLHFDIRQYNCIDWSDCNDLRRRLADRIEAHIGHGNYRKEGPA